MTITVPQGNIAMTTSEWLGDFSPEAIRYDIAVLALAAAEARYRIDPNPDNALRLHAAEVTFLNANAAMFAADEEIA